MRWRDPAAYVHGIDAPVVVIPGRVAAWLETNADLARLRQSVRGRDAEVDSVLVAMATVAAAWRVSATGTEEIPQKPSTVKSGWLSTTAAADRLGVSTRFIRMVCISGELPAEKVDGRWWIAETELAHYESARESRS